MSYTEKALAERKLPPISNAGVWGEELRLQLVQLLEDNIYGRTPKFISEVSAKETFKRNGSFGGKGNTFIYNISATTQKGIFSFPLYLTVPNCNKKVPLFAALSFDADKPSGIHPDEEILDRGIALAKIRYQDITADTNDEFCSGVAAHFERNDPDTDWGKIGMWAWAASRALDFLLTLDLFDTKKLAVVGHSRLGKTALWCGAQDTRFTHIISNNAGCSGDAITRGKVGETVLDITHRFGYWFCGNYKKYIGDSTWEMPFDQHMLMACIAPRRLAVGASDLDRWADPESEYLCCAAASKAWEALGVPGFIHPDRKPEVGDNFRDGNINYHLRDGSHALIRKDWMIYSDFLLED